MSIWSKSVSSTKVISAERSSLSEYWSLAAGQVMTLLDTSEGGLSESEAARRLAQFGPNRLQSESRATGIRLFVNQFRSPLVLILVIAAMISALAGEWPDAAIVIAIVAGTTALGFAQEYRAHGAIEKLRSTLARRSAVIRNNVSRTIPSEELVPGDIITLTAGTLIPADEASGAAPIKKWHIR